MIKDEYRYRFYVGPYHLHYNWSQINLGAAFAPPATTTTGQISGATALAVPSTTGFDAAGGVWVAPNGTNEDWEYERTTAKTTTSFTVERESATDRDHSGVHTNGAAVSAFVELKTNDGRLQITDETDERQASVTWQATLSGVLAPLRLLRNGHVVVATESVNGGAYTVALLGFLDSPSISDDWATRGDWTVNIVSSASLVGEVDALGVRVGDADLANAGSASSATPLVLAYDERRSGDYVAATPDVSGQAAIDGDLGTVWLTERYVGTDIWTGAANGDEENDGTLAFATLYLNPPIAAGAGARYIELRVRSGTNVRGMALNSANGGTGVEIWIFNGPGDVPAGGSIYLVEDEEVFTRLNPLAQQGTIYENRAYFQHIRAAGGEFWLRLGERNMWLSRVRWGDGNGLINHPDAPDNAWHGATVTAPSVGQTMRYLWNASGAYPANYWQTSLVRHTGYNIDNDDNNAWLLVTIPGIGITLAQDITASSPANGGNLYLYGPDKTYSTDGLSASGTLVIGDEEMAYVSKTTEYVTLAASGGRGANGTTAASHKEGDLIYIKDGTVYTDAYLISAIGWKGGKSGIYPKAITLYRSNLVDKVRTPEEDNYLTDWTSVVALTTNSAASHTAYSINARVRHLLYEVYSMTQDPARVRLAEVNVYLNPSTHNANLWMATNTSAGALIQRLCELAGLPTGALSHSGTPAIATTVTARDNAWSVVVDTAEFAGCRVTVARDSKLVISADTFWTGTPTTVAAWTRSNAVSAQKVFRKGNPVSQVVLPWKTPSGDASGKAIYPATAGRGRKQEEAETLYANASAAATAARRLYYRSLYPFEVMVQAAGTARTNRAGEAHSLTWAFTPDRPALSRTYVVLSAEHTLDNGHWSSTFRLMQYGHESNF